MKPVIPCMRCAAPTIRRCKACASSPSPDLSRITDSPFCSKECQAHCWSSHKKDCKASVERSILVKVAETLQEAVLFFRKATWDFPTLAVRRESRKLIIVNDFTVGVATIYPTGLTFHIPDNVWSNLGPHDRASILVWNFCGEAAAIIQPLFKALLGEIVHQPDKNIQIVSFAPKPSPLTTHDVQPGKGVSPDMPTHNVIRIRTKSGQTFAIDLAGAQHGWHATVTPWDQYTVIRVQVIVSQEPLVQHRRNLDNWGWGYGGGMDSKRMTMIMRLLDEKLGRALQDDPAAPVIKAATKDAAVLGEYLQRLLETWKNAVKDAVELADPLSRMQTPDETNNEEQRRLFDQMSQITDPETPLWLASMVHPRTTLEG